MQQISLYQAPPESSLLKDYYPFPQLALALLVLMLVLYALALADHNKLSSQLALLVQQDQLGQLQLEKLRAEASLIKLDPKLQLRLTELQAQQLAKKAMLRSLDLLEMGNLVGFSAYLEGLARRPVPGLWLTRINLERGGEHIGLQGVSTKPEHIPRLLQNLAIEPVYQGSKFDVLELNSNNQPDGLLFFDVRAEQVVR